MQGLSVLIDQLTAAGIIIGWVQHLNGTPALWVSAESVLILSAEASFADLTKCAHSVLTQMGETVAL